MNRFSRWSMLALLASLLGAVAPAVARADEAPTPAQLLVRARQGRAQLMEAVEDVRRFVPELESKEKLFPYLLALDELAGIQSGYDLSTIGTDPTKMLGLQLARHGYKWVEFDRDSQPQLEAFFRWADSPSRYSALSVQVERINLTTEKSTLLRFLGTSRYAIELNRRLGSEPFVIEKAEDVQASLTKRLLKMTSQLTPAETERLMRDTASIAGLVEALGHLDQEAVAARDVERLRELAKLTLVAAENVLNLKDRAPYALRALPGKILIGIQMKLLERETGLEGAMLARAVEALTPSQVVELSGGVLGMFGEAPVLGRVAEPLWQLSNKLLQRLNEVESQQQRKEFEKLFQRLASARLLQGGHFEGTYDVTITEKDGSAMRKGILTLAAVGASNFSMGLNVLHPSFTGSGYGRDYNFFDVVYDLKREGYVAQYRAVESPKYLFRAEPHWHLKFNLVKTAEGKWTIEGEFFDGSAPSRYQRLHGVQVEAYPQFSEVKLERPLPDFAGIFRGAAHGAAGPAIDVIVTRTGASVGGKYFKAPAIADVPFEWGYYNQHRNTIYLTTGEFPSSKWVHVRGQLSNDGSLFHVYYILSGWGIQHEAVLRRAE